MDHAFLDIERFAKQSHPQILHVQAEVIHLTVFGRTKMRGAFQSGNSACNPAKKESRKRPAVPDQFGGGTVQFMTCAPSCRVGWKTTAWPAGSAVLQYTDQQPDLWPHRTTSAVVSVSGSPTHAPPVAPAVAACPVPLRLKSSPAAPKPGRRQAVWRTALAC